MVQLVVEHALRMLCRVNVGKAQVLESPGQGIGPGVKQRRAEIGALRQPIAVQVCAPFMHSGDERHAETPAPVTREVGETRAFVVLPWRQVGIGENAHRHKQEGVAKALQRAGQRIVGVVRLQGKSAVVQHR